MLHRFTTLNLFLILLLAVSVRISGIAEAQNNPPQNNAPTTVGTITQTFSGTTKAVPPAPTNLSLSASSTYIRMNWTAPTTNLTITGYDVQYRVKGTTDFTDASYTGTDTTWKITGVTSETTYQVRVRANATNDSGSWSSLMEIITLISPPTNVTVSDIKSDAATISWTAPRDNIDKYMVLYRDINQHPVNYTEAETTTTSITLTGLSPFTNYGFIVAAKDGTKRGEYTGFISFWTKLSAQSSHAQDAQPNAPTTVETIPNQTLNFEGTAATVNLSSYFSDPDGDALSYTAYSSNNAIATVSVSGGTVTITPVAAGTATITVTATDPGNLTATQIFAVTTKVVLPAPTNVTVSDVKSDAATISWTAPKDNIDRYVVLYRDISQHPVNYTEAETTTTSITLTGLSPFTNYGFIVAAKVGTKVGEYTGFISFWTKLSAQSSHAQDTRPVVRLIYFLPRDREPQPNIDEKMDRLIKDAQQLYTNQLEAHGFGRKTFQFEMDSSGNAVVHHFIGQFTDTHYSNLSNTWNIWEEIGQQFDASKNIYVTVIEMSSEYLDSGGCDTCSTITGRGGNWGSFGGRVLVTVSSIGATAHELGHAFGLMHDYRTKAERVRRYSEDVMLNSFCAAEWLDAHRAFNPARSFEHVEFLKFKMLPPSLASPPNAIRLRFEITDPNRIHQVQLLTEEINFRGSLLGCKSGNSSGTFEFVTTDLTLQNRALWLRTIDVHGNIDWSQEFPIDITSIITPPETILIPDKHLAAAVRGEIGDITTHSMLNLFTLNVPNSGVTDLTGLEHAHNLEILNLGAEYIESKGLINSNTVSDVSALSGLTRLRSLNLDGAHIDMSTLSGLTHLRRLFLGSNNISDISALSGLTHLRTLFLGSNNISDISTLSGLTYLRSLNLGSNNISDISALSGLTHLDSLYLVNNNISDISALSGLTYLRWLNLVLNNISDISVLSVLTNLTWLNLGSNPLSYTTINTHIPTMQANGVEVIFDKHQALLKISGDMQEGSAGTVLAAPFIVEAVDAKGKPMRGVSVVFAVTAGGGQLSTTRATTDGTGKAQTLLTLGGVPGKHTVTATATAITKSVVTFTAIGTRKSERSAEDVNGDGVVNILDLVVVSSQFGRTGQNEADVNGDGVVNIQDLVLVAAAFHTF